MEVSEHPRDHHVDRQAIDEYAGQSLFLDGMGIVRAGFSQVVHRQLETRPASLAVVNRLSDLQNHGVVQTDVSQPTLTRRILATGRPAGWASRLPVDSLYRSNGCVGEQDVFHADSFPETGPVLLIDIFEPKL